MIAILDISPFSVIFFERATNVFYRNRHYAFINDAIAIRRFLHAIIQFDSQFDSKGLETAERFSPIINNLKKKREKLFASLDMIMYHPVLLFGASEENRTNLIEYIKAWEQLYHAICVNEPRPISCQRPPASRDGQRIHRCQRNNTYVQPPVVW